MTTHVCLSSRPRRFRTCAILLALGCFLHPVSAQAQQAVIIVRHAEKLDASADPPLSADGEARAAKLASMLRDAGVTAIYATKFQRTRKTAEPLAAALTLPIMDTPACIDELVTTLRAKHADDVVLVVGHSNTVPEMLGKLGYDRKITIADTEYDNLFVVIPRPRGGAQNVFRLRY